MATCVNFGQQRYFGFDPRTVPGCVLWLDALDSNTLYSDTAGTTLATPGGAIARWNDKSVSSNYVSQGTAGNRPTLSNLPSSNGYPALYFAGTSANLTSISNNTQSGNLSRTMFLVMHVVSGGIFRAAGTGTHAVNSPPSAFGFDNNVSASILFAPYVYAATDNTFSVLLTGTRCVYAYYDSTVSQIGGGYNFSIFNTKSTTLNTTATPWYFGSRPDGAGSTTSYLGEVLLYNSTLTTDQRQQVEGYLAWKWNIQSTLPTSHPYTTAPPTMRLFQPVDVTGGALLWLDAADPTTVTGSPVTEWRDKSGRASNATTGLGSIVAGTAINSLNTLQFGMNMTLNLSNFVMPSAQTSVFYVLRGITTNPNSAAGTGYFIFSRTADNFSTFSGNEQFFSYQNPGVSRAYLGVMGPGGERSWSNTPTAAFYNTTSVISTTGVSYSSVNGTSWPLFSTCNVSNTVFTASTYQIGTSRSCCGDVYTYDLGELIVCDGTISIPVAQQVEGYLAWKWGVRSSLPTTHPYYNVPPSAPAFRPSQLSGLVLWMDPTDSTTVTLAGSSVTQWRDKSASAATFTTVNGNPTYTSSLINGLPGIDLTNSSGFVSSATQTLTSSLTLAIILVVKSGVGAWGSFFTHGSRDLDLALERYLTGTTLQFQTANDNTGANLTFTTDQVALYLGTMTTGTSRFFERFGGGTTTTTTATNSSTITPGLQTIRIGRSDGGENCNSLIGEIVYYNRVLTSVERQGLEGYLAWKWGLQTSLPASHPYAKFTP